MEKINKIENKYWGFAYLRPRSEKKVAADLKKKNIAHYLPLINKARLHHGTKIVTQVPMINSYIFLAADEFERTDLKRTISNFVQIELFRNSAIEERLIKELNALQQVEALAKKEEVLINPGIKKGDKVMITQGELKGLETEVLRREDNTNSIIINITILETSVEYKVSAEILEKLTS